MRATLGVLFILVALAFVPAGFALLLHWMLDRHDRRMATIEAGRWLEDWHHDRGCR